MRPRLSVVYALASLVSLLGAAGVGAYEARHAAPGPPAPPKTAVVVHAPAEATPSPGESASARPSTPAPTPPPLPASLVIQTVPFTIQAPYQNWDRAHEEYCEAAAVYMVGQYYSGDRRPRIPPAEAESAMGRMVGWERSAFPGEMNLSLAEMGQVGLHFYGLQAQVVPLDLGVAERSLAAGRPVIIPVMTEGGPGGSKIYPTYGAHNVYHVIVLTGYDAAKGYLYTNDPGLREGQSLGYPWSTLASAVQAQAKTTVDGSGLPVPYQQGQAMLLLGARA